MNNFSDLESLIYPNAYELNYLSIVFNFIGAMVISFLLRSFYIKYSLSLTGKVHIGSVLPVLTGIIFLIIIVIKSSLALSLGLIGALSIVRFRTPIKEPEELTYIFLAIAIGLGFGAGYALVTAFIVLSILGIIYFWLSNKHINPLEYNLVINWKDNTISNKMIIDVVAELTSTLKLLRHESNEVSNNSVFVMEFIEDSTMDDLVEKLRQIDGSVSISFFESKISW